MSADRVAARARLWSPILRPLLDALYGDVTDTDALLQRLVGIATGGALARRASLEQLDIERETDPSWFQHSSMIGYVAYADLFGGTLQGVADHLDYLSELRVTYLHLMKVLRARDGANDGGYAVLDYRDVDPSLGTWADLEHLADQLHERGVSLCLDLVMNHTASDHEWAERARAGSDAHRRYYLVFPDRDEPDRYEAGLPEVFPEIAPGNFTWDDQLRGWVWTTFHDYQWDLNYANPDVLVEMLQIMIHLANSGVDVLRLDAVAFTWKRLGTNCQNQPEAHLIAQVYRALMAIAAPAVLLKAEAIVAPADLLPYLGVHRLERPECHLAYHNQLMVMLWSSLAAGDAALAAVAMQALPPTPASAGWVNYVRCHDDIGWAVSDDDAAAVGLNGPAHREFLARFYRGDFWQSFADGVAFSSNPDIGD
ncbi:MAG: Amylosucrase, partial [Actinomycetota bacterium]